MQTFTVRTSQKLNTRITAQDGTHIDIGFKSIIDGMSKRLNAKENIVLDKNALCVVLQEVLVSIVLKNAPWQEDVKSAFIYKSDKIADAILDLLAKHFVTIEIIDVIEFMRGCAPGLPARFDSFTSHTLKLDKNSSDFTEHYDKFVADMQQFSEVIRERGHLDLALKGWLRPLIAEDAFQFEKLQDFNTILTAWTQGVEDMTKFFADQKTNVHRNGMVIQEARTMLDEKYKEFNARIGTVFQVITQKSTLGSSKSNRYTM